MYCDRDASLGFTPVAASLVLGLAVVRYTFATAKLGEAVFPFISRFCVAYGRGVHRVLYSGTQHCARLH